MLIINEKGIIERIKFASLTRVDLGDDMKIEDVSDGYHTFKDLYHHRALLFSTICNLVPNLAWKSKLHDDGTMFDGMFIVGITTPEGNATYHYDIDPYWDMFKVKELENAPKFDGHTPEDALNRIYNLKFKSIENIINDIGLRSATYEERESIEKHIEEISIPTGINIFDLYEENTHGRKDK